MAKQKKPELSPKLEKYKAYCEMHNRRPVSRRDFLSAGVIGFSGYLTLPPLLAVLARSSPALAEECAQADRAPTLAAFITLNLSGGAMLAANFVPHDAGGQPLSSYNIMGMGNGAVPITREFGDAPFAGNGISKLITSLRATAAQTTRDRTAFVAVNSRSQDDTGNNMLDASGMVAKAGLLGTKLPNLGARDTDTGINQRYSSVKPPNPLIVRNLNDLIGALGLGGSLGRLSQAQQINLLKLVQSLNDAQAAAVMPLGGGQTLSQLVSCGAGQNVRNLASTNAADLDPRQNANVAAVWGINANSAANSQSVVFASMVMSALTGVSGSAALEMGGYDYHDNTRTSGDTQDGNAGDVLGRILQTAAVLNKKVFVYVTSDGATVSPASDDRAAPWSSDRGSAGCGYMLAFDPAGRPPTGGFQLGHFTAGQAADDKFITGGSAQLAAAAVFVNWLSFNKRMDLAEKVIPGTFSPENLKLVTKIG
jgi:hypothetical protein